MSINQRITFARENPIFSKINTQSTDEFYVFHKRNPQMSLMFFHKLDPRLHEIEPSVHRFLQKNPQIFKKSAFYSQFDKNTLLSKNPSEDPSFPRKNLQFLHKSTHSLNSFKKPCMHVFLQENKVSQQVYLTCTPVSNLSTTPKSASTATP